MKTLLRILALFILAQSAFGQHPFKQIQGGSEAPLRPFSPAVSIPAALQRGPAQGSFSTISWDGGAPAHEIVRDRVVTSSGSIWMHLHPNALWSGRQSAGEVLRTLLPSVRNSSGVTCDWRAISEDDDPLGMRHIRMQQTVHDLPVYGQDLVLHLSKGELTHLNGYVWTGRMPATAPAVTPAPEAIQAAAAYVAGKGVTFTPSIPLTGLPVRQDEATLIWFPINGALVPAYEVSIHPNALDLWTVFVHAGTMEVLKAYSELCSFAPLHLFRMDERTTDCTHTHNAGHETPDTAPLAGLMDGATTTSDTDLSGASRTVHAWQVGTTFFMVDASRPSMFNPAQSNMPDEPVGVIWTIDAQGGSPSSQQFQLSHCFNNTNNWTPLEVSAHHNGGVAFEYFRQTFNRNSINGQAGNIISIINVTDEDGLEMDNAYWNGAAMFYGNGNTAFTAPLARALDVAGHEMSHGVIQNTSNLEYVGQSGALNESYADIFGAMIDRDDWQMGEDVSNPAIFPSGALRDLANPNNGGTQFGDNGWQPKHMNEYVELPNTPQGDNGGVHINSGIPNRAFVLVANAIGKDKAEQIYYRALTTYLVRSSQFIDMRLAAVMAATDLHGSSSAEVNAVRAAFDGVGIGAGTGGSYEEDIEVNEGADFIIATDAQEGALYIVPPDNPGQFVELDAPGPKSIPSFTDNGTACVYVDHNDDLILLQFDWTFGLEYGWTYLESSPQGAWRNIAVSKDGSRIAYTTSLLRKEIYVFDFASQSDRTYTLYNPTTASGGFNTGDVLYADVMEWDYSGEFIIYDALNQLPGTFGDGIEYWDIGYVYAWDNASGGPGTGQIGKLFNGLPQNVSVGNPSLAKNSPYILAFDYLEVIEDIFGQEIDYRIKAVNLETGAVGDIFENTTVGYPSYSRLDDQVLFTYDDVGNILLGTVDLQANKLDPVPGTEVVLITGAQKGVWFLTGDRMLTSTIAADASWASVRPNPATDVLEVLTPEIRPESYQVVDQAGRVLEAGAWPADNRIDVRRLSPGIYYLRLLDGQGGMVRARFVKA